MLQACDKALGDARQAQQLNQMLSTKQDELQAAQKQELIQLKQDSNSLLKSPLIWFVGGMLVTGLTVRLVK